MTMMASKKLSMKTVLDSTTDNMVTTSELRAFPIEPEEDEFIKNAKWVDSAEFADIKTAVEFATILGDSYRKKFGVPCLGRLSVVIFYDQCTKYYTTHCRGRRLVYLHNYS